MSIFDNWKILKLEGKKSSILIRTVGTLDTRGIGISVEEKDEWNGGVNSGEYFPTVEEIDLLITVLTQIKSELQEK